MSVLEALAREVGSVSKALHGLSPAHWETPTRCAPMDVRDLVAHMARGATRIREMLAVDPVDAEPERDGITYWRTEVDPAEIVARAQASAAEIGDAQAVIRFWDEQWSHALRDARAADPTAVRPTPFGRMRLDEYLRTRVLEVTVHHMDLDDAVGHAVHPDAGALEVVGDILRGLLGTDLRPFGVDDVRFALTGTGRAELDDAERGYLGPLVDAFPLIR